MCQEFCPRGGRGVSKPTPGGRLGGSGGGKIQDPHTWGGGWGIWLGGLQAHTWGCIPACTEADTPLPSRRLLLRVVLILLECILVFSCPFGGDIMFICTLRRYSSPERVELNILFFCSPVLVQIIPLSQERVKRTPPPSTNKAAHYGFEAQRRRHQKSKNRGISGPTKRTYVLQNFFFKKTLLQEVR